MFFCFDIKGQTKMRKMRKHSWPACNTNEALSLKSRDSQVHLDLSFYCLCCLFFFHSSFFKTSRVQEPGKLSYAVLPINVCRLSPLRSTVFETRWTTLREWIQSSPNTQSRLTVYWNRINRGTLNDVTLNSLRNKRIKRPSPRAM